MENSPHPSEDLKVISSTGDEKTGDGKIRIHKFTQKEKVINVMKKIFLFWGLSLFCVFIPVLHFFLTPLFFLIGIYSAVKTYKINFKVLGGEVLCSNCKKPVQIGADLLSWPLTEICQNCVATLRIRPADASLHS